MMLCVYGLCVYVVFCIFFFFFKQKTAYEMRISDWSSDVCSSDLYAPVGLGVTAVGLVFLTFAYRLLPISRPGAETMDAALAANPYVTEEIGRASCRERVCQYV